MVDTKRLDWHAVRDAAAGRWVSILSSLAPEIDVALRHHGGAGGSVRHIPCPVHGGKDGFRVFSDVDETGGGICNTCGSFPDGFDLLKWLRNWTFVEALQEVASVLGMTPSDGALPPRPARPRPEPAPKPAPAVVTSPKTSRKTMRRLWVSAFSLDAPEADLARRYFASRGLDWAAIREAVSPKSVRFHPAVDYYEDGQVAGTYPALLAAVRDAADDVLTLHRTYLAPDGTGKAPVAAPRKLIGSDQSPLGGAIRLGEMQNGHLAVAEGLETALAAWLGQRSTYAKDPSMGSPTAVWSCVSGPMLAGFVPPPGVRRVTIWADKDRALYRPPRAVGSAPAHGAQHGKIVTPRRIGEHHAWVLADRLAAMGIPRTIILVPPGQIPDGQKGIDWADVWATTGLAGFESPEIGRFKRAQPVGSRVGDFPVFTIKDGL